MLEQMLEKLDKSHSRLQNLAIQPTKSNMEILLQTLYDISEVYKGLKEIIEKENKGGDDNVQC